MKGAFQWNDRLRISPCPRNARVGRGLDWFASHRLPGDSEPHLGPPYPFVLEVKSFRSPNPLLETNRALRNLDTYQYLMTLLLHGGVRYAQYPSGRHWVGVKRRGRIEYHLLHPSFDTGLSSRADQFARRRMKSAPVHPTFDYYNHLWDGDSELQIPASLTEDLVTYHALPADDTRASTEHAIGTPLVWIWPQSQHFPLWPSQQRLNACCRGHQHSHAQVAANRAVLVPPSSSMST